MIHDYSLSEIRIKTIYMKIRQHYTRIYFPCSTNFQRIYWNEKKCKKMPFFQGLFLELMIENMRNDLRSNLNKDFEKN